MTPERAGELAGIYTNNYCSALAISPHVNLTDYVQQAILQACAEQRESDAKICEKVRTEYAGRGGWTGANACYIQIRREK